LNKESYDDKKYEKNSKIRKSVDKIKNKNILEEKKMIIINSNK